MTYQKEKSTLEPLKCSKTTTSIKWNQSQFEQDIQSGARYVHQNWSRFQSGAFGASCGVKNGRPSPKRCWRRGWTEAECCPSPCARRFRSPSPSGWCSGWAGCWRSVVCWESPVFEILSLKRYSLHGRGFRIGKRCRTTLWSAHHQWRQHGFTWKLWKIKTGEETERVLVSSCFSPRHQQGFCTGNEVINCHL